MRLPGIGSYLGTHIERYLVTTENFREPVVSAPKRGATTTAAAPASKAQEQAKPAEDTDGLLQEMEGMHFSQGGAGRPALGVASPVRKPRAQGAKARRAAPRSVVEPKGATSSHAFSVLDDDDDDDDELLNETFGLSQSSFVGFSQVSTSSVTAMDITPQKLPPRSEGSRVEPDLIVIDDDDEEEEEDVEPSQGGDAYGDHAKGEGAQHRASSGSPVGASARAREVIEIFSPEQGKTGRQLGRYPTRSQCRNNVWLVGRS
jgi:hypothetical protein